MAAAPHSTSIQSDPTASMPATILEQDKPADAPRRGSRVKKPTRKALGEELPQAAAAGDNGDDASGKTVAAAAEDGGQASRSTRRSSRVKADNSKQSAQGAADMDDKGKKDTQDSIHPTPPNAADDDDDETMDPAQDEQEDDESDQDDTLYCLCKGKDDGSPMISCEGCHDWFHFRCISLTKTAARKLRVYLCPNCVGKADADASGDKTASGTTEAEAENAKASTSRRKDERSTSPPETASDDSDSEAGSEHVDEGQDDDDDDDHEDEDDDDDRGKKATGNKRAGSKLQPTSSPKRMRASTTITGTGANDAGAAKAARTMAGSPSTQVKSSPSIDRKSPVRKPSISAGKSSKVAGAKKKIGSGAGGASSQSHDTEVDDVEAARAPARRVLAGVLDTIFAQTSLAPIQEVGGTVSLDMVEQTKSSQERANEYAAAFEQEMFELTAERAGSLHTVGQKYREKFRTFLFSLKDKNNPGLHLRIASGQLLPKDLAHMSKDELANESIRKATEKAKQEALHSITLVKSENVPHRKITHKGEIEIENESYMTKDQGGKFARPVMDSSSQSEAEARSASNRRTSVRSPTTVERDRRASQQTSPASRAAQSGSASVPPVEAANPMDAEPAQPRARTASVAIAQSPTSKFDFSSVWTSAEAEPSAGDQEGGAADDVGLGSGGGDFDAFDPGFSVASPGAHSPFAEVGGADDFIDTFLGGGGGGQDGSNDTGDLGPAPDSQQEAATVPPARTPEADPPSAWVHRYRPVLWSGALILPEVGYLCGVSRQIAGQELAEHPWSWSYFFPTSHSVIEGRLPSKMATDYLLQVRTSPKTRILVFTLEACFDPIATAPEGIPAVRSDEANDAAFAKLVDHFKSLDRWGVLHKSTRARESGILKDIYLVPLKRDDPIPVWLDLVEPDALGAEWSRRRDRDLFLVPVVVYSGAIEIEAKRLSHHRHSKAASRVGREGSADATLGRAPSSSAAAPAVAAPAPLAAPTAAGGDNKNITSTALQDLLRSIGKSTSTLLEQQSTPPYIQPSSSNATPWSPLPPAPSSHNGPAGGWSPLPPGPPPPPGPAPRPPGFLSSILGSDSGSSGPTVPADADGSQGSGYNPHAAWGSETPPSRPNVDVGLPSAWPGAPPPAAGVTGRPGFGARPPPPGAPPGRPPPPPPPLATGYQRDWNATAGGYAPSPPHARSPLPSSENGGIIGGDNGWASRRQPAAAQPSSSSGGPPVRPGSSPYAGGGGGGGGGYGRGDSSPNEQQDAFRPGGAPHRAAASGWARGAPAWGPAARRGRH